MLALAICLMLVISLDLVLESITNLSWIHGTDILVQWQDPTDMKRLNATEFDPVLKAYSHKIENFGLLSSASGANTLDGVFHTN